MKQQLLDEFPYAIIRVDAEHRVLLTNLQGQELLKKVGADFFSLILEDYSGPPLVESRILPSGEILFIQVFVVNGTDNRLVLIGNKPDFLTHLPNTFEQILENFTADPSVVNQRIASLVQKAVTFERFDLMRVDPALRKYNYEYSIGLEVEGTLHTAYRSIINLGLGWIVQNEAAQLVETLSPDKFSFREDPQLYRTGLRSILRVPIIFDHEVIGAVLLASSEPGQFQIEDAMFLDLLSKLIAPSFFYAGVRLQHDFQTLCTSTLLQTITFSASYPSLLDFLNQYCTQLGLNSKIDRIGICLINQEQGDCSCIAGVCKSSYGQGKCTTLTNIGIREMIKSKSIVAFNLADPRFQTIELGIAGQGITAVLYAPIENQEGKIIAALTGVTSDEFALSLTAAGIFKFASDHLALILTNLPLDLQLEPNPQRIQISSVPKGFEQIIGSSEIMRNTVHQAAVAAKYDFPILITGETGTGKELFAKAIHQSGPSSSGPFIVVNSTAIPPNLLESELFGYTEGAFTGGLKGGKKGKFLLADKGTVFLDEIGELSPELQAKLLRVIQEQEVEPLGASKPIPVHVRIISATHRDLRTMVQQGEFREDLLYRLNAIEIQLPPLRLRGMDILDLAESMLHFLARTHGTPVKRLSPEARAQFLRYAWPGNVRQLQNVINRLFVFTEDQVIQARDLPPEFFYTQASDEMETEYQRIKRLLSEFDGNKTALAQYLGITRTGLWKKLKRLGLQT
ncbi:sigma 54-interacting transcriptional regulator [Desulfosporosinus sp. PR]|uniref:sigma-54-dependent Fis family transcriptional regulator n=1 Tax=Candidatus Desulfosporosinus nitrosoreducens TaxID=3401928 RepID=UPI0027F7B561|nr:sigma 54-interacting transcriptional regulator [Desulfosporosinus sp. PR]MDQ7092211.1 sigma 54-interacting transcriptional regulator [Desulfosporosinus sp. PR]